MRRLLCLACALLLGAPVLARAAGPPAWVREVSATQIAADGAPAVVLLDELVVNVSADGRAKSARRFAVRVLDRSGRDAAAIRGVYLTGSGKIRHVRGWILRASGAVRDLGDRDAVDMAVVNNDVYNEVRIRALAPGDDMAPGDIFAAEIESEDRLLFAQFEWAMQDRWPASVMRRRLILAPGWDARGVVFNGPALEPQRVGQTFTWEARGVPALPREPAMPPASDLAPRVAVSLFGPASAPAPGQFERWGEVSAWLYRLSDGASQPSPAIAAKARELTASASTDLERARLIGTYAQRIQYVSIQTGIGRGGGYQPRPASLVMERNYGDCKDKAGLMRAMLASVGITSHLVTIYSGDRNYVRPEWPSPQQFNHVIVGISLPALDASSSAVFEHPQLGRLLAFDPTDEHTPFGALPVDEQGSLALVVAASGGELVRMPVTRDAGNAIDRTIEGRLDVQGTLKAEVRERFTGAFARRVRAQHRTTDAAGFRRDVQQRIGSAVARTLVGELVTSDDAASNTFTIETDFTAPTYAQAQGKLLLVRPPFELGGRLEIPHAASRRTPLLLEGRLVTERVRLQVPAGFMIEEVPEGVTLSGPFGLYELRYSVEGSALIAQRTFEVKLQKVAPPDYAALTRFFAQVRAADVAPAVLAAKRP